MLTPPAAMLRPLAKPTTDRDLADLVVAINALNHHPMIDTDHPRPYP